jgi:hypothetical protein
VPSATLLRHREHVEVDEARVVAQGQLGRARRHRRAIVVTREQHDLVDVFVRPHSDTLLPGRVRLVDVAIKGLRVDGVEGRERLVVIDINAFGGRHESMLSGIAGPNTHLVPTCASEFGRMGVHPRLPEEQTPP